MKNNKLNTYTLSALIIGPVMGSGIILLPTLLYDIVNTYSLFIWIIISILGLFFALIFAKLSILYKGEGGVSLATKNILGKKYQLLTSFYLIFAVFFGPVAVILIGADFLKEYFPTINSVYLAFVLYIITYLSLLFKIDFLAKIMLYITSFIVLVLLFSSINILSNIEEFHFVLKTFNLKDIGHSFLLAFWAIVGWEVIGNYSSEVKSDKTITNAVLISAIIVSFVYMLIASAIVFGTFSLQDSQDFNLIWVLEPLFKDYSQIILVSISALLCVGTLILFVGGVARLISSLKLSKYTSKHLKNGSPNGALNFLAIVHIIVLFLVYEDILNKASLVAIADGFFIANAIIGLITAIAIFKNGILKTFSYILAVLFFIILLFSNIYVLFTIVLLFIFTYFKK